MTTLAREDWNRLWETYADSASENPAQAYRRKLIFSALTLGNTNGQARLLDIGSGQGDFSESVLRQFPKVELLGLELSRSGVAVSQRKVPGARFIQQDLTEFKTPPEGLALWATHAVCSEMLEHVEQPERVLQNMRPYLAPGCRLVVTVPGGPMSQFDRHIGHHKHYSAGELRGLLESNGFQVESVWRAGFPFMNFYRLVVILRGKALVRDVALTNGRPMTGLASVAMSLFSFLFRWNRHHTPWGWQMVAVARKT